MLTSCEIDLKMHRNRTQHPTHSSIFRRKPDKYTAGSKWWCLAFNHFLRWRTKSSVRMFAMPLSPLIPLCITFASLTTAIEKKLSKKISAEFAITFDSWFVADTHYIAIFATFPAEVVTGYNRVCWPFFELRMKPRWVLNDIRHSLTIFSRCLGKTGQMWSH